MERADLAPKAFSTMGLPAAHRVELWETHNVTALIGLDVQASEPLVATELNVRLPFVDLARVAGSAHVVRRTRKVIERSPAGAVAVYLTLRGDAWFECTDRTYALRPGNILVSQKDEPFARGFSRGLEELVVKVDRAALRRTPAQRAGHRIFPRQRRQTTSMHGHSPASPTGPRGLTGPCWPTSAPPSI